MSLSFPQIDPVLAHIGPVAIHWYAVAYLAGFVLGWWQCMKMAARTGSAAKPADYDDYLVWAVLGTVLGGRIGYVLFYQFDFYMANPLDALMVWHGGMSFHGGMMGVILAAILFTKRRALSFWGFADLLAVVAPIGLFFGRLANFVNGELFGRTTDVAWGMIFPRGGDSPRHPSQLYEAALEGLVLYTLLTVLALNPRVQKRRGLLSGLFLALYGTFRFVVEFFREPDPQLGFLFAGATMGQLLCAPMALFGAWVVYRSYRSKGGRMSYLDGLIRETIQAEGPLSVARYMQLALQHPDYGYYVQGCPIGARGDFVTAPEISQMFGELIGLWCAQVWLQMGSPSPFTLLEMGPGRGTLMADALRASVRVPGFHAAMQLCLLESNATLREAQSEKLSAYAPRFLTNLDELAAQPLLVVANEFFDALPIHQYRRTDKGWHEVLIGIEGEALAFVLSDQPVPLPLPETPDFYEVCPAAITCVQQLAAHIARHDGAALVVDYGYQSPTGHDTLQAVSGHTCADPLEGAGTRDLTAHVDFSALRLAAEKQGLTAGPVVGQGDFLRNLGIEIRARQLKMSGGVDESYQIDADLARLTDEKEMGALFKVFAFARPALKDLAGFP